MGGTAQSLRRSIILAVVLALVAGLVLVKAYSSPVPESNVPQRIDYSLTGDKDHDKKGNKHKKRHKKKKVKICHRTGSRKNPYVKIRISKKALYAHKKHGDIYPVPKNGCPKPYGKKPHGKPKGKH
jgi:hypothetical protein